MGARGRVFQGEAAASPEVASEARLVGLRLVWQGEGGGAKEGVQPRS